MSENEFEAEAIAESMLPYLGLPDEADYRPGIVAHLVAAHGIATDLLALPLEDETEPAPVFKP